MSRVGLILLLLAISCTDESAKLEAEFNPYQVNLRSINDSVSMLQLLENELIIDEIRFDYPIYELEMGDLDCDGSPEILVGLIKPTRNDSTNSKRLFIYQLKNNKLVPKWLGSRVGQPLKSFKVIESNKETIVRTIEFEHDGSYLVAEYEWYGFGLSFKHYIERNLLLEDANQLLKQSP